MGSEFAGQAFAPCGVRAAIRHSVPPSRSLNATILENANNGRLQAERR